MPRTKQEPFCKICGTTEGHISKKKLCTKCAIKNIEENVKQMTSKQGAYYEKWLENTLASIREQQKKIASEHRPLTDFTGSK